MSKFNENVKDLFENWNTIPNWLCFVRIALIPVFSVLFIKEQYIAAFITMIVAALTDVFDGKIARKYNMVSNLGKILDPIADKLSQIAIVIILLVKFWDGPLKYILFLFIFKELLMIIGAAILRPFSVTHRDLFVSSRKIKKKAIPLKNKLTTYYEVI